MTYVDASAILAILNGEADGFIISPAYLPGAFEEFVQSVVPELQRRGLFRTEYETKTLRDHLGLGAARTSSPLTTTPVLA